MYLGPFPWNEDTVGMCILVVAIVAYEMTGPWACHDVNNFVDTTNFRTKSWKNAKISIHGEMRENEESENCRRALRALEN